MRQTPSSGEKKFANIPAPSPGRYYPGDSVLQILDKADESDNVRMRKLAEKPHFSSKNLQ